MPIKLPGPDLPKIILLIYSPESGFEENEIQYFLNARSEIINWVQIFENAYVLLSRLTVDALSTAFQGYASRNRNGVKSIQLPMHFIVEVSTSTQGILPKAAWDKISAIKLGRAHNDEITFDDEIPF